MLLYMNLVSEIELCLTIKWQTNAWFAIDTKDHHLMAQPPPCKVPTMTITREFSPYQYLTWFQVNSNSNPTFSKIGK